jgi:YidC/Oxa1 family membrane protein insertase
MEKRLLLAFVLSAAILLAWSVLFPPPQRQPTPETPLPTEVHETSERADTAPVEEPSPIVDEKSSLTETSVGEIVGSSEEEIELTNENITVILTNRGAAVSSYLLANYDDGAGLPVDLVQDVPVSQSSLPLQLITPAGPDEELYAVERLKNGVTFRWADGRGGAVHKTLTLSAGGYGLDVEIETAGSRATDAISIGTGMRNLGAVERGSRLALWGEGVALIDGELSRFKRSKVKESRVFAPGVLTFVGFEDAYFLNLLRPDEAMAEIRIEPIEYTEEDTEDDPLRALRISVVPSRGELRGQLLGAPKEYDLLQSINQGVEKTLTFGWFLTPIAVFFLKALRWIYSVVGNWGVAIILLTLGIRIVLFPLMHTSTVSMRKMQKVQPKVKEIQAKHKKKKSDPQARAKMNQEMMALYKEEGVNPMAGCLPLLVQMPVLFALYQLFLKAIELRQAPFIFWITDLSAKDPLYVTPILMTATMWLQQRLAPQAGDPQQQRLMRMMPLIFGIMFLGFPSGLVLYWLANNVITIIQQELTLHMIGERRLGGKTKKKAGGKRGNE